MDIVIFGPIGPVLFLAAAFSHPFIMLAIVVPLAVIVWLGVSHPPGPPPNAAYQAQCLHYRQIMQRTAMSGPKRAAIIILVGAVPITAMLVYLYYVT